MSISAGTVRRGNSWLLSLMNIMLSGAMAGQIWAGPVSYRVVDLGEGVANGVSGGQQVGEDVLKQLAFLWTGSASTPITLGTDASATGVFGGRQVGTKGGHAVVWAGNAQSVVDLNPQGFGSSQALGIGEGQVVGFGTLSNGSSDRALLWTGFSADSAVDLTPASFDSVRASAVSGGWQVGFGAPLFASFHPLLWHGSADSVIDLLPTNLDATLALARGVDATTRQVVGLLGGAFGHAILWNDFSAEKAVDLNPAGFTGSSALGVGGGQQVGFAELGSGDLHAMVWSGTSQSALDLHKFVPSVFSSSAATAIDKDGVIAGYGLVGNLGPNHALLWIPASTAIPLPPAAWSGLVAIALFAMGTMRSRLRLACL
jgi:hypothetical protein